MGNLIQALVESYFQVHRTHVDGAVEARVIAVVGTDAIRVIVGVGVGQLDSGSQQTWPLNDVPRDLRRPNATFWVTVKTPPR